MNIRPLPVHFLLGLLAVFCTPKPGTAATLTIGPKHSPDFKTDTNEVSILLETRGHGPKFFPF